MQAVAGYNEFIVQKSVGKQLKLLPSSPGVYYYKNHKAEIIYIGKAAKLNNRVRQYFQKSRSRDAKTQALVTEITDIDWMVVDSEVEALFLEAEMIRRYMPKYNILLRDDKSMSYIRIDYDSDYPTITTTRRPLDDGAKYFGPYINTGSVKQALKYLRRIFPYATKKMVGQTRASLHYHLGLDPGLEEQKTSLTEYRKNLRNIMAVIEGRLNYVEKTIEKDMKKAAKNEEFELAAKYRNQLNNLKRLSQQVIFSDKEFLDISKDHALDELTNLLQLKNAPARIEGYDVSHMQGTDVVASMVVFTNGVSNKSEYRKFKTKINQNNDFYNMNETIKRRFSPKNINSWKLPDFVLIDGGKGQLDSALSARNERGQNMPFIGLAKREEQIIIENNRSNIAIDHNVLRSLKGYSEDSGRFTVINLPHASNLIKLLQRVRDESHRFAVSYHSTLKTKRVNKSALDEVPSIGPVTKKQLLKTFGSVKGVKESTQQELEKVVGSKKASILKKYLN